MTKSPGLSRRSTHEVYRTWLEQWRQYHGSQHMNVWITHRAPRVPCAGKIALRDAEGDQVWNASSSPVKRHNSRGDQVKPQACREGHSPMKKESGCASHTSTITSLCAAQHRNEKCAAPFVCKRATRQTSEERATLPQLNTSWVQATVPHHGFPLQKWTWARWQRCCRAD